MSSDSKCMERDTYTYSTSITNNSKSFWIVADAQTVLAACDTMEQAVDQMEIKVPSIHNFAYAEVRIIAPGETWNGEWQKLMPISGAKENEFDAEWQQLTGLTPDEFNRAASEK